MNLDTTNHLENVRKAAANLEGVLMNWERMAALGTLTPAAMTAVSIFRLTLWQMRDPVSNQQTRIFVQ